MTFRSVSAEWQRAEDVSQQLLADPKSQAVPAEHISFHAAGARSVLFDSATQNLYLLNRVGAFIWCSLAEGMSQAAIAHELVRRSNSDLEAAAAAIRGAVATWHALGLMRAAHAPRAKPVRAARAMRNRSGPPPPESHPADSHTRICRVLDCDFAIRLWDRALEADVLPLLGAHLVETSRGVTASLDVARSEGGSIAIRHDAETMQVVPPTQSVAPAVFASLMRLALVYSPAYPALHAATVRTNAGVVLFPGASGSGKSTLMAGLQAAGRRILGDDTAVFERDTMRVRPLTPYICVKSGSWPVLADRLPHLMDQPHYRRGDAAEVRYLVANGVSPGARSDRDDASEARAIVFARYQAGAPTRLTRIGGFLALKELLPSLDPIGHDLTAHDVNRLIAWMGAIECHALSFGSLDDAIAVLDGVLA